MASLAQALTEHMRAVYGRNPAKIIAEDGRPLHEQAHDELHKRSYLLSADEERPALGIRRTAVVLYEAWCDFLRRAGGPDAVIPPSPLPAEWHEEAVKASAAPKRKRAR